MTKMFCTSNMARIYLHFVLYYILSVTSDCASIADNSNLFVLDNAWPSNPVKSLEVFGSGVAVDSKNNVIILHRSTYATTNISNSKDGNIIQEDVVMVLDRIFGKIVKTWGRGMFVKPHGIEVSDEGDIFVTDVKLHQVFKFLHNAETGTWMNQPDITLGERFTPGSDHYHFCSPADVAIMPNSNDIYIADGYCNSRIIIFDKFGSYIREFGAGSNNPGLSPPLQFNVTHAIAIAAPSPPLCTSSETPHGSNNSPIVPIIFVADRNNGRVQCFAENGTYLYEMGYETFSPSKEMLFSLAFTYVRCNKADCSEYGTLYAVNGHMPIGQPRMFEISVSPTGFSVVHSFPITQHSDNSVTAVQRNEAPHDITVTKDGQILYVVEAFGNLTIKKFVRNRINEDFSSKTSNLSGPLYIYFFIINVIFVKIL